MKLLVEIEKTPNKDDIIIYDGSKWVLINKNAFLQEIDIQRANLNALNKQIDEKLTKINEKLKDYHNILQQLTKEK